METAMDTVISNDGTPIAYETAGSGPAIVFATGAFNDHHTAAPLAAALADGFTVVTYDRRARGESGDTRPYAIEREVEDLAAVIGTTGGPAAVFGFSSGAVLALRAAADGLPITHLFLYEAPFATGGAVRKDDLPARLQALIDAGEPGEAVSLFQSEGIGLPPELVAQIRQSPMFGALTAIAQSTVYDATLTTELAAPSAAMTAVTTPTVVMTGAQTWPVLAAAARELAETLPGARRVEVEGGENHGIAAGPTAAVIRDVLTVNNP
jgi:pimeloyl-ACP methyl ester carboxylesterase